MDMVWNYKVGDIVRVRSSCAVGAYIGNIPFVTAMSAYKGKVFRIKSCEIFNEAPAYFLEAPAYFLENVRLPQFYIGGNCIDGGNFYYFGDEMLEKIFYIPSDDLLDFLSDDN